MVTTDPAPATVADRTVPLIVVGIDGSDPSKAALAWAVREAKLTGAELRVVIAWHVPAMAYGSGIAMPPDLELEQATREVLDEAVKDVRGQNPSLTVSTSVAKGPAAPALIASAEDATLLVVGSRGHGAFAGMLLGSVSEYCVSHAPCPVVVVRDKTERD
jgi:nucleotide-binding universal stress UspA family protein